MPKGEAVLVLSVGLLLIGALVAMVAAAVQRSLGSRWLWGVAGLAFVLFPIAYWDYLVEQWRKGLHISLILALLTTATCFSVVPAYGVWRVRNRNPVLSYWRHAGVGFLAILSYAIALGALFGFLFGLAAIWRAV